MFRVNHPYLNLLVKLELFSGAGGGVEKNIILCNLKGEMPFKMHKIIVVFQNNKYFKIYMCAYPTYNFQTRYPKHISDPQVFGNDHNKPHSLMSDPISTMYFHNMFCDLLNKILFKPNSFFLFGLRYMPGCPVTYCPI